MRDDRDEPDPADWLPPAWGQVVRIDDQPPFGLGYGLATWRVDEPAIVARRPYRNLWRFGCARWWP